MTITEFIYDSIIQPQMKTRDNSRYDQWVNLMDIFRDVTDLKTGTGAPGAEVMGDVATAKKARHFSGAVTEP